LTGIYRSLNPLKGRLALTRLFERLGYAKQHPNARGFQANNLSQQ
jgi:hypothetical protein